MIYRILKRTAGSALLQHILFWAIAWYIMLRFFSNSSETGAIDYIYTTVFLITLAVAVYLNLLLLIPWLLEKRKYILYLVAVTISTGIVAWFNMFLFSDLIDYLLPGYYFISYYEYQDLIKIFFSFVILTTLLELSKGWFRLAEARNELVRIEKEQAQAELSTLKSQINPHFLFNSLNSLYSLVITKSVQAPAYILELSGFLRYILYETPADLVSLDKELQSISNYLEIQKLRAGESSIVTFKVTGDTPGKMIAPLLFLPLVENAFRHGNPGGAGSSIEICVEVCNASLSFSIHNTVAEPSRQPEEVTGIGISNLKRRLQRLYPGSHTFITGMENNMFKVSLVVPLQYEAPKPDN
ncbi:MAG TPA: histidine kinase [Lentimicrobium sp.]|nr:histidine kinase [Lentimicrobium sp.]